MRRTDCYRAVGCRTGADRHLPWRARAAGPDGGLGWGRLGEEPPPGGRRRDEELRDDRRRDWPRAGEPVAARPGETPPARPGETPPDVDLSGADQDELPGEVRVSPRWSLPRGWRPVREHRRQPEDALG